MFTRAHPLNPVLSQMNPGSILTHYFFKRSMDSHFALKMEIVRISEMLAV